MTEQVTTDDSSIDSAASALSAGLGAWLPIETAPKDGTKVMVACPWLGVCGPANWNKNEYAKKPRPYWTHWGERTWGTLLIRGDQPTHWQPMPEAPNVEFSGAGKRSLHDSAGTQGSTAQPPSSGD